MFPNAAPGGDDQPDDDSLMQLPPRQGAPQRPAPRPGNPARPPMPAPGGRPPMPKPQPRAALANPFANPDGPPATSNKPAAEAPAPKPAPRPTAPAANPGRPPIRPPGIPGMAPGPQVRPPRFPPGPGIRPPMPQPFRPAAPVAARPPAPTEIKDEDEPRETNSDINNAPVHNDPEPATVEVPQAQAQAEPERKRSSASLPNDDPFRLPDESTAPSTGSINLPAESSAFSVEPSVVQPTEPSSLLTEALKSDPPAESNENPPTENPVPIEDEKPSLTTEPVIPSTGLTAGGPGGRRPMPPPGGRAPGPGVPRPSIPGAIPRPTPGGPPPGAGGPRPLPGGPLGAGMARPGIPRPGPPGANFPRPPGLLPGSSTGAPRPAPGGSLSAAGSRRGSDTMPPATGSRKSSDSGLAPDSNSAASLPLPTRGSGSEASGLGLGLHTARPGLSPSPLSSAATAPPSKPAKGGPSAAGPAGPAGPTGSMATCPCLCSPIDAKTVEGRKKDRLWPVGFPIFAMQWSRNLSFGVDRLIVGGGGGTVGTGVGAGMLLCEVETDLLPSKPNKSQEWAAVNCIMEVNSQTFLVSALHEHPSEPTLACAIGDHIALFRLSPAGPDRPLVCTARVQSDFEGVDDGRFTTALRISPDGNLVVSGGGDHALRLWALPDLTHIRDIGKDVYKKEIKSVDFSADSSLVAGTTEERECFVWSTNNQAAEGAVAALKEPCGATFYNIRACRFVGGALPSTSTSSSSNAKPPKSQKEYLVGVLNQTSRGPCYLGQWDVATWKLTKKLLIDKSSPGTAIETCGARRLVGVGTARGTILVVDGLSLTIIATRSLCHDMAPTSLTFSPDGLYLASGSADKSIAFLSTQPKGCCAPRLKRHAVAGADTRSKASRGRGTRISTGVVSRGNRTRFGCSCGEFFVVLLHITLILFLVLSIDNYDKIAAAVLSS